MNGSLLGRAGLAVCVAFFVAVVLGLSVSVAGGDGQVSQITTTQGEFWGDQLRKSTRTATATGAGGSSTVREVECHLYNLFGSQTRSVQRKLTSGQEFDDYACGTDGPTGTGWKTQVQYTYDTFERLLAGAKRPDPTAEDEDPELDGSRAYCYDALDRRTRHVAGLPTADDPSGGPDDDERFDRARRACTRQADGGDGVRAMDLSYVGMTEQVSRESRLDGVNLYDYGSNAERLGMDRDPSGTGPGDEPRYRAFETDGQGSVVGLDSASTGVAAGNDRYQTDPYGAPVGRREGQLSGDAPGNPFRFQGFYNDPETGLYDMQARTYRPDQGRFLQEDRYADPAADLALGTDPLTASRYAFTAGNPSSRVEVDGHWGFLIRAAVQVCKKYCGRALGRGKQGGKGGGRAAGGAAGSAGRGPGAGLRKGIGDVGRAGGQIGRAAGRSPGKPTPRTPAGTSTSTGGAAGSSTVARAGTGAVRDTVRRVARPRPKPPTPKPTSGLGRAGTSGRGGDLSRIDKLYRTAERVEIGIRTATCASNPSIECAADVLLDAGVSRLHRRQAPAGTRNATAAKPVSRGWSRGDDAGNAPAWSTVRGRYWKNAADDPAQAGQWSDANLARMRSGRAPQRYNADKGGMESMELSHEPVPARAGGRNLVPRWPQDHAAVDPYRRPGY
ncbi:MAG: RHS repeat-associated core domain-containing protein [Solirubrobacteraceae bacterium]